MGLHTARLEDESVRMCHGEQCAAHLLVLAIAWVESISPWAAQSSNDLICTEQQMFCLNMLRLLI
jgi:hypothetical protein